MIPTWLRHSDTDTHLGRTTLAVDGFLLEYYQSPDDQRWYWKLQNPRRVVMMSGWRLLQADAATCAVNAGKMIGVLAK